MSVERICGEGLHRYRPVGVEDQGVGRGSPEQMRYSLGLATPCREALWFVVTAVAGCLRGGCAQNIQGWSANACPTVKEPLSE
jgi:hypothetical protein